MNREHRVPAISIRSLHGAVVTFGALHTVRATLNWLVDEKKAHYIAVVKRNHSLLHARVRALPWRQLPAGTTTRETAYAVTSLPSADAYAQDLARLVREHWSIEARRLPARPRRPTRPHHPC